MSNYCDPVTGICTPSSLKDLASIGNKQIDDKTEIIYVGDPMCSWCWGISPALIELRDHFAKEKIGFRVLSGGLRPGGGDPWNEEMKNFLKEHWGHVTEKSGQPFGYALMDLEDFNYDTEPSCRAVVAARPLVKEKVMEFFEAIQRKFYVESQDPNKAAFYSSICDEFGINYGEFLSRFESNEVKQETMSEFQLNRQWGVKGYPSILLLTNDQLHLVANGYATFEQMKNIVDQLVA
ncbi:MAG: DsbA family protein [Ekhidna sp.]